MYTMYMKQYTVAELRKDLRNALNSVEAGEMVVISRHGVSFVITTAQQWNQGQTSALHGVTRLVTDEVSSNIRPDIQAIKKSSVATPQMSKAEKDHHDKNKAEQDKIDSKIQSFMAEKKIKFCANGHAIPDGRSKCMGKGCKYAK